MAVTLLDVQKDVLNRLNEDFDSPAGDLETGSGGAPTIATLITIRDLFNEAVADMARSCYPVPGTATTTLTTRTALLSALTPTVTGQSLWTVRGAKFVVVSPASTTALRYAERAAVERNDPSYLTTATSTPAYWYNDGPQTIGVYPVPVASGTLTVDGYVIPAPLVNASDTIASTIPDDLVDIAIFYAAARLAQKNMDDASMYPRADVWMSQYDAGRMDLWTKIPASLRRAHFPTPPVPAK